MIDTHLSHSVLDPDVYNWFRQDCFTGLFWLFDIASALPPDHERTDMGRQNLKSSSRWGGSDKAVRLLAGKVQKYCTRWEITTDKFAELAGVGTDTIDDLLADKPKRILLVAEYNRIASQLARVIYNRAGLAPEVLPDTLVEKANIITEPAPPEPAPPAEEEEITPVAVVQTEEQREILSKVARVCERLGLSRKVVSRWAGYSDTYFTQALNGALIGSDIFYVKMLELLTHPEGLPPELQRLAYNWKKQTKPVIPAKPEQLPLAAVPDNGAPTVAPPADVPPAPAPEPEPTPVMTKENPVSQPEPTTNVASSGQQEFAIRSRTSVERLVLVKAKNMAAAIVAVQNGQGTEMSVQTLEDEIIEAKKVE